MKTRFMIAAVTAFSLAAPLVAAQAFAQAYHQQSDSQQGERGDDGWRGDQARDRDNQNDGRDMNNGRHHDRRHGWRETRRDARWDDGQHNGYYRYGVWRYGPPPAAYMNDRHVSYGYRPWARGQRLGYYANRYQEVDYRRENLRQPRRGYHWVRNDGGDFLLAAIATGLIAQVIINSNR